MRCRMALCRGEEAGGFAVTVVLAGQSGEAFEDVGNEQVCLEFGGARQRVVGVALGLFRLTRRDRHAGARPSAPTPSTSRSWSRRPRRPSGGRRRDPGLPARPRHSRCAAVPPSPPLTTVMSVGGLARLVRRRAIPGGQGRESQTPCAPNTANLPPSSAPPSRAASAAARAAAASPWYASARL